ncbi:MAG TPA: SLBB domain-containing protein [Terriglobales bacterium]|nr:SLBB domain-containing protein [Terriglobales bacterium]
MAQHHTVKFGWLATGAIAAAAIAALSLAAQAQVSGGGGFPYPTGVTNGAPVAPAYGAGTAPPSTNPYANPAYGSAPYGTAPSAANPGTNPYTTPPFGSIPPGNPAYGSSAYGQTAPGWQGSYSATQSYLYWRAAACARDPRNCSNAPYNGYLGPNDSSSLSKFNPPITVPYGSAPMLGPYGSPAITGPYVPPPGGTYAPPALANTPYGQPAPYAQPGGFGANGVPANNSFAPTMSNPPTGALTGGAAFGPYGQPPMGYVGPSSPGLAAGSANLANTQMPSLNGPPPAGGFPSSGGFPNSGTIGSSTSAANGGLNNASGGNGAAGGSGISNLLGGIDQNTLNTVAAQLGVSTDQLNKLKTDVASGAIGSDQLQQLSARFGALNLSDNQMNAIGRTLGLSDAQMGMIKQTLASARGSQPGMPNPGFGPPPAGIAPMMPAVNAMPLQVPPSPIEVKFQQIDNPLDLPQPPTTDNLTQFGYNFFVSGVSTFAPVANVPVGNDYVIGPGDEIDILLWGRVNTVLNPVVDRQGMIQVTEIGPLQVAGLTFQQAKKLIEAKASKMTGVQVDVTMGQLRTINVTVAGDVVQPGSYQISALSRVSNALVAAGGVSKVGSLRNIEVRHGNQLVDVIDMYDILLHGNNSADRRLEEGDVIFVPVIGSVVGIAGDVKRPAIYELKKDHPETLDAALRLAGGITGFGFGDHLQVERIQDHKRMVAINVSLRRLTNQNFTIRDGDVIKVYPVMIGPVNMVMLSGNVRRPGNYPWYKGMRLSDLIKKGDGVLPNTYLKYALVRRLSGPGKTTHFLQADLGDALANPRIGQGDIALQPKDEVDIYNVEDVRDLPSVAVNGEVRQPGRYVFSPDMKVSDLVFMAGGLKDDAYQDRVVLVRTEVGPGGKAQRKHFDIDLRSIMQGNYSLDTPLKANDELFIRSVVDWQRPPQFVEITGEVRIPGIYDYYPGMRVGDLVALAGGTQDDAFLKRAELARTEVVNGSLTRHTYIDIDLRPQAQGPNDKATLLKPNDELLVKAASNYHLPFTVTVSGKVMRPGVYTIREGERLHSVLERCGGFLPDAFVQGIVFRRVSVQQMEQERLNEARERLSKEAANVALTQAQLASFNTTPGSGASSGNATAAMMVLQNVLSASTRQAEGRMVIHVNAALDGKPGPDDVVLEDGDEIDVPVVPSSVMVMGEVNHPSSFLRLGSKTVRDYINDAGGFTRYADKKQVIVIKADGSVLTADGYDQSRRSRLFPALPLISGGLMESKLEVGDTVFVPEDLSGFQNIQMTKDITQIVANSAQSIAMMALLATQL